jgi:hypothetical protein
VRRKLVSDLLGDTQTTQTQTNWDLKIARKPRQTAPNSGKKNSLRFRRLLREEAIRAGAVGGRRWGKCDGGWRDVGILVKVIARTLAFLEVINARLPVLSGACFKPCSARSSYVSEKLVVVVVVM